MLPCQDFFALTGSPRCGGVRQKVNRTPCIAFPAAGMLHTTISGKRVTGKGNGVPQPLLRFRAAGMDLKSKPLGQNWPNLNPRWVGQRRLTAPRRQVSYTLPRNRTYPSPSIRLPINYSHITCVRGFFCDTRYRLRAFCAASFS